LFDDFAQVLSTVDVLILTEVYAAGETPLAGADGRTLSRAIRVRRKVDPVFIEQVTELSQLLPNILEDGDLLLLMGAGNIGTVAAQLGRSGLGVST
jgi:UDP-N-acetylmuramate--alanine ligase